MMGCTDGNEVNKVPSSFEDLNLRPHHVITTFSAKNTNNVITPITPPNSNHTDPTATANRLSLFNHHPDYSKVSEQGRNINKDLNNNTNVTREVVVPMPSSRWSPTPEQLLVLEELYRHGKRTPTAQQIQEITAMLRRFGKIEGKNVFYWFQNHKARDKRKRRKITEANAAAAASARSRNQQQFHHHELDTKSLELTKEFPAPPGSRVTGLGVEQTKQEPFPSSSRTSEEFASLHRVAEGGGCTNRLVRLEEKQLGPIIKSIVNNKERHTTWKPMETSYCFPANYFLNWARPIVTSYTLDGKPLQKTQDSDGIRESRPQTLELFPLRSDNLKGAPSTEDTMVTSEIRDSDFNAELSLSFLL